MITLDLNQPCTACSALGRVLEDPAGRCRRCYEAQALDAPAPPPPAGPAPNAYLAARLADLIARVRAAGDHRFRAIDLRHGLRIEVGLGAQFNLRLSRAGVSPSVLEWRTVVANLPPADRPPAAQLPRDYEQGERGYLEAHWPLKLGG